MRSDPFKGSKLLQLWKEGIGRANFTRASRPFCRHYAALYGVKLHWWEPTFVWRRRIVRSIKQRTEAEAARRWDMEVSVDFEKGDGK